MRSVYRQGKRKTESHAYYIKHRERILKNCRQRRLNNLERYKQISRTANKLYYIKNKTEILAKGKAWWKNNKDRMRLYASTYRKRHPDKIRTYAKRYRASQKRHLYDQRILYERNHRDAALAGYGAICKCCGISQREFLCFDHVNNDGAAHRRNMKGSIKFYKWIKKNDFPNTIQVLCHNCNMAKAFYGICPHQISS